MGAVPLLVTGSARLDAFRRAEDALTVDLHFDVETESATGTVLSISPTLYPIGHKPTRGLICTSPTQNLSVTLQSNPDGAKNKLAPGTQINFCSPRANDDSAVEASH